MLAASPSAEAQGYCGPTWVTRDGASGGHSNAAGQAHPQGLPGGSRLGTGQQLARLEWAIWTVFLWASLVGQQGCLLRSPRQACCPQEGHMGTDTGMSVHRAGLVLRIRKWGGAWC